MCGIVGVLYSGNSSSYSKLIRTIEKASYAQRHRGPDIQDYCVYERENYTLAFSHQRLSIIDLSDNGKQPMEGNKSSIIFNGEIYNYKEIKSNLPDDVVFKSETDTEVLLNALECYGLDKAVNMLNGMWAFAWYDVENSKLYLCRDRMGVKPLYYYVQKGELIFSSEVKSIVKSSEKKFKLNYQSIGEYLVQSLQDTHNNSFFEEINQIPAGCYGVIDLSESIQDAADMKIVRYWNPDCSVVQSSSKSQLEEEFKNIFYDAVKLRLRSDVPVGVTLSGGLDSSAIATVMKSISSESESKAINCLSAVSPGSKFDESEFIQIMQEHLDANLVKVTLDWQPKYAIDLLHEVTEFNDSPLGSFSNVAHYLLMKKAKENNITVILSGQGADEILCGYKKFVGFYFLDLIRKKKIFSFIFELAFFLLRKTTISQFKFKEAKRYIPLIKKQKNSQILSEKLLDNYRPKSVGIKSGQTLSERQFEDVNKFSVPYLTHYEDRMSMAWAREVRLPFLDFRLVEFCLRLPENMKIRNGWTKYILREALNDLLPKSIAWRKDKQGFVNPQEEWLKNELKEDVIRILSPEALIFKMDLVNRKAFMAIYEDYCDNKSSNVWYRDVFAPLALEIWLQINKEFILNE
ncbi:asparagine synthase (glutamine-hydrolyzing) [Aeromonas veronii]|uniref:asparagine synthase (glutamine-hydrolyzing) n=3 Tax=Aeromonas TaxID=642 RepID=A0A346ACG8_AERHY|nr:asparagine synthase (glutamine-hydrolyzing) [Aeromonas veronii]AXL04930.1 asparagine synthetase [Aeromonas hydrophila]MCF5887331.1 asparagine synthase (glutamine-hydrolyzing) [Aeromonas veronii]